MAKSLIEQLREQKKTGLERGEWFNAIPENMNIEVAGIVQRVFDYKVKKQTRLAVSIRLAEPLEFKRSEIIDEKTGETKVHDVEVQGGELVNIGLTGQLEHIFDVNNVMPGTVAVIEYLGKDETVQIQGNHPHSWAYAFQNPDSAE